MKRTVICLLIAISFTTLKAQVINNVNGTSTNIKDFSDVRGSAYLNENWGKATVTLADGKVYNNIDVKFNQYEDKLYFKSYSGEILSFTVPVKDFTITYTKENSEYLAHYRNGYSSVPGVTTDAYLEVLADGKTQLLKRITKRIEDRPEYPNTTTNKVFVTLSKYYILNPDGKAVLINRDKKSILSSLNSKHDQLEAYIKANSINLKKDEDLAKLISYYNSI